MTVGARDERGNGNTAASRAKVDEPRLGRQHSDGKLNELFGVGAGNQGVLGDTVGLVTKIPISQNILQREMRATLQDSLFELRRVEILVAPLHEIGFIDMAELTNEHCRFAAVVFDACFCQLQTNFIIGHGGPPPNGSR